MKTLIILAALFFIHGTGYSQNVGIGTVTPQARLHVTDSSVVFSAAGSASTSAGNPPVSGGGRRMMWYADKSAFRAGYVNSTNWDKDSIGEYSTALGNNNKALGYSSFAAGSTNSARGFNSTALGTFTEASGFYSTSLGYQTTASGSYAISIGSFTKAIGNQSFAAGDFTIASGTVSTAFGYQNTAPGEISTVLGSSSQANGDYTIAIGESVTANSWISTSLGRWNNPLVNVPTFSWVLTEPLLMVGNGTGPTDKRNALMILKNGNTGLGVNSPNATLDVARGITGVGATTLFRGSIHYSYFNYGVDENTYISGGKNNSHVILSNIPGGYVGIGTDLPNAPMSFAGTLGRKISLYESAPLSQYGFGVQSAQLQIYSDAAAAKISFGYFNAGVFTERMWLNNSTGTLTVNATAYPSDGRYKKHIHQLQYPLEKIKALNGVEYLMRSDEFPSKHFSNGMQVGLIAQEVEKVLPQAVHTDADGYKAVDYAKLIPLLVEGIKEQQKLIEQQQQEINELKARMK